MKIEYRKHWSHALGRDMEYKVYGHRGRPVLVFPTSGGRFFQYEDSGMIAALAESIDAGQVQIWTIDGIDGETFLDAGQGNASPADRIARHESYFRYVHEELQPQLLAESVACNGGHGGKLLLTGCSMGAFHAANYFFRFPWAVDALIALSGVYSTRHFFGEQRDTGIYLNSPIHYLANLDREDYLNAFRASRLIFCAGQGAFEEEMVRESREIGEILKAKDVPAWVDIWGHDVDHDWPWWQRQIVYYLKHL